MIIQGGPSPEQVRELMRIIIPLAGMATGIIITGFIVLGPVGRSIGDVIRRVFGAGSKDQQIGAGDMDELRERLDAISHQLGEVAERQDFSERMLAQFRKDRAIAGGTDVPG